MRGGAPPVGAPSRAVLPKHPLARHIDDFFLTDLANANKPRNTSAPTAATAFAAHYGGDIAGLSAALVGRSSER